MNTSHQVSKKQILDQAKAKSHAPSPTIQSEQMQPATVELHVLDPEQGKTREAQRTEAKIKAIESATTQGSDGVHPGLSPNVKPYRSKSKKRRARRRTLEWHQQCGTSRIV
jgi:hypothetical protein